MKEFTTFDATTGATLAYGLLPNSFFYNYDQPNEIIIEGKYGTTHWMDVATENLIERTAMGTSIDATTVLPGGTVTISGIPAGTSLDIDEPDTAIIDDGVAEVTLDKEGVYILALRHYKHFDDVYRVTCDDGS